jgi:hypothetical protein
LLLLDGFNEVSADYRDRLAADIRDLMERWPRVRMIVSSRPGVYHDAFRCPAFVLDALDDGRIREFLEKFFARAGKPREAERFHEILSRHPRLKAWGRNPLGLRMLAAVGLRHGDLPANRGKLMESFVATILAREADKERQQWDAPRKTFFLGHLAFETRRAGRVGFTWEESCGILRKVAERIGHPLDGPAFLQECEYNHLLASAGWLRDQGRAFAHEMYQEYFAAAELLRRRGEEPGLVETLRRDPFWEEPLILYAGLAPDADEVIRAMSLDQPLLAARSLTSQLIPAAEVQADVVARAEAAARHFKDREGSSAGLLALVELGEMDRLLGIFGEIPVPTKNHKKVVRRVVTQVDVEAGVRFLLALATVGPPGLAASASDAFAARLDRGTGQLAGAERIADPAGFIDTFVWPLFLLPHGGGTLAALAVARECGLLERLDVERLLSEVVWPLLALTNGFSVGRALTVARKCRLLECLDAERLLSEVVWPLFELPNGAGVRGALAVVRECGLLERLDPDRLMSEVVWPLLALPYRFSVDRALAVARECGLLECLDAERLLSWVVHPLLEKRKAGGREQALAIARECGLWHRLDLERLLSDVVAPLLAKGSQANVMLALEVVGESRMLERLDADRLLSKVVSPMLRTRKEFAVNAALELARNAALFERFDAERILTQVVRPLLAMPNGAGVRRAMTVAREFGVLERLDGERVLSGVVRPLLAAPNGAGVDRALSLARDYGLLKRLDAGRILSGIVRPLFALPRGAGVARALSVAREGDVWARLEAERVLTEAVRPLLALPNGTGVKAALAVVRECGLVGRLDPERIREGILEPLRKMGTKAARAGIVEIEQELASVQAAAAADEVSEGSPAAFPAPAPAAADANGVPEESAQLAEPSPAELPASIAEVTTQVTLPPLPPPPPPVSEETPPASGGWFSWWRRRPKA